MPNFLLAPFSHQTQISPTLALFLAAIAVIILGISKSGFGGGVGILAVPLFALALGAREGTALLLPFLIAADSFSVYHHWKTWDARLLKVLAPGTLAGVALGSVCLFFLLGFAQRTAHAPPSTSAPASNIAAATSAATAASKTKSARDTSNDALNLLTGIVCVAYIGLDQIRKRFAPRWHFRANQASGAVAGICVGTVSTISHAAGPIAAIFLLGQNIPRQTFIGTTVIYFFVLNLVKLMPFSLLHMYNWPQLQSAPWFLLLLVPVGTSIGALLNRRLSEKTFRNIIMLLVLLSGIDLITSTFGYNILSLFT